jgi:Leucine-rich repeat (LRR) protein
MGQIPSLLSHLISLNYLDISECQLSGSIPSSLSNLTQLSYLAMCCNQLIGQVPSWLANLTQLTTLALSFNKLEGPFPFSMYELKKLEVLDLYSNNLSGVVTLDKFSKLKYLTTLLLSMNNISFLTKSNTNTSVNKFEVSGLASCNLGHFPDFLRNQDRLQYLDLSYNNIHGQIPKWVWNTSKETLRLVNFSHNFLTGFDHHLSYFPWPQLKILDLRSNKLQSLHPIPPPFTLLYLVADNMLQGEVSPLICNLSSLYSLDLSNNKFQGILPHCLSNFSSSLSILNLRGNNFHGMIPQICAKGSRM